MAFERDLGTCCVVFPLKLGVGIISMLAFVNSLVCILALVSRDIRFMPNGYDRHFLYVPSIVGAFGLVLGFIGLLGTYDNKPRWVRVFSFFMQANVVAKVAAAVADYVTLWKCDSWLRSPDPQSNKPLLVLAQEHVCPYARVSYIIGASIDIVFWIYVTYRVSVFAQQIELQLPFPLEFGDDRYDVTARWRNYKVKDPRPDIDFSARLRRAYLTQQEKEHADAAAEAAALAEAQEGYGATEDQPVRYGPDGMPIEAQSSP